MKTLKRTMKVIAITRRVTRPGIERGTATRDEMGARCVAIESITRASLCKLHAYNVCVVNVCVVCSVEFNQGLVLL